MCPPLYTYEDQATKKRLEVIRTIHESDDTPTFEEALEAGFSEYEYDNATWKKLIGGKINAVRSPSWGKKGHWLIAFALLSPLLFSKCVHRQQDMSGMEYAENLKQCAMMCGEGRFGKFSQFYLTCSCTVGK